VSSIHVRRPPVLRASQRIKIPTHQAKIGRRRPPQNGLERPFTDRSTPVKIAPTFSAVVIGITQRVTTLIKRFGGEMTKWLIRIVSCSALSLDVVLKAVA